MKKACTHEFDATCERCVEYDNYRAIFVSVATIITVGGLLVGAIFWSFSQGR